MRKTCLQFYLSNTFFYYVNTQYIYIQNQKNGTLLIIFITSFSYFLLPPETLGIFPK